MTDTAHAHPWDHQAGAIGPELAQLAAARSGIVGGMTGDAVGLDRLPHAYRGDSDSPQRWRKPNQDGALESTAVGDQIANEALPGRPRLGTGYNDR